MRKGARDAAGADLLVVHVLGSLDVGGVEIRTLRLQPHMKARGIAFAFVTLSGRAGQLADEARQAGSLVLPTKLGPRFPVRFVRLLRDLRPQTVDSHVATFSGVVLLLATVAGVPRRIAHFRSDGDGRDSSLPRRAQRSVMSWLVRRTATDIVGVSPGALEFGYGSTWTRDRRCRVVPNGVPPWVPEGGTDDLRAELGIADDSLLVIGVSRGSEAKNRARAVHVLRALVERGLDAHLVLVGRPDTDSSEVLSAVTQLDLADRVHLRDHDDAPRTLMSQADVLLLTSIREGLPGVVLESLSTGTPVVASDLPGVRYIAAQVAGVTPVPLDRPDSEWASAVADAATTTKNEREDLRSALARSTFSEDIAVQAHANLYRGGSR